MTEAGAPASAAAPPELGVKDEQGDGSREGPRGRSRPDRQAVRQGFRHAAGGPDPGTRRGHPHGLGGHGRGPGHRRPAARPRGGDLRPGVLGQDHPGPARGGQRAAQRRHRGLHRRGARPGPGLRPPARGGHGRPAGQPAGHRRAGPGDHGHARLLGHPGHRRHRLRGRADPARRDRGRDGRLPRRPAGPPHVPGAAQGDRPPAPDQDHGHLHQPAAREDRRVLRLPGDHHGRQGAQVLCVRAHRRPPHRDPQGGRQPRRQPHPREDRQEQDGPALQAGRVRHPLRGRHLPRGRPDRHGCRGGHRQEVRRVVHL
ncbi:Uncharacterised protein [Streptococcus pneumoniae]|nr:Uncharacterised protein [Streptococcus pneumoniae]